MKKVMTSIFILLLSFTTNVSADAGNNIRHSSRSLGSSSYGSSTLGTSWGINQWIVFVFSLGIFVVGAICLMYLWCSDSNKVKKAYNPNIKREITKIDSQFSESNFLNYAKEAYIKIQNAWSKKDWKEIRQYETDNLYHMHLEQLQEYVSRHTTNIVEIIEIKDAVLSHYEIIGEFECLTVLMRVKLKDYIIDDSTKKVLEGDKNTILYTNYQLIFMRKVGQKTRSLEKQCLNCGAKDGIHNGICEYCGYQWINDWLLNSIKLS